MNRPCRIAIKCPGPTPGLEGDSPIVNYSSEQDDGPNFSGYKFPIWRPYDPGLPGWWSTNACAGLFTCVSTVSQEDADDCAQVLADLCALTPVPPTNDPCVVDPASCATPSAIYYNTQQSCEFQCPDGTTFTYTVQAGKFVANSQDLANQLAKAAACDRVRTRFICIPEMSQQPCLDTAYSALFEITGVEDTYTIEADGIFPPGIAFTQVGPKQFVFSGTAYAVGSYAVSITATSPTGVEATKVYLINVMGISNASTLATGTQNAAYSVQLNSSGGTAPYTYALISGALPTGLTLTAAGLISGTPTVEETKSFTVEVSDSTGAACSKTFSIEIQAVAFDWSNLSWYYLDNNNSGPCATVFSNPASVPDVQNFFSGSINVSGIACTAVLTVRATISYNGPLRACAFNATSAVTTLPNASWFLRVSGDHFPVINLGNAGGAAVYPFNIPDTGGVAKNIYIEFEVSGISFGFMEIADVVGFFS